ncbi:MAG: transcription-repair coupling factor [Candidatus Zhuqueibacterota bacterium]
MVADEIKALISKSPILNRALERIQSESHLEIKGLAGSLKSFFLVLVHEQTRSPIVFITGESEQEEVVRDDLEVLFQNNSIVHMPKLSDVVSNSMGPDSIKKGQLLFSLEQLIEGMPKIVIIPARNLLRKFPSPKWIKQQRLVFQVGQDYDFDELKENLIDLGFNRESQVEDCGEMSIRGGIVDVYPFSSEYPYRIEFFGNTIESIRIFDPSTQRSIDKIINLTVYPQLSEDHSSSDVIPFVPLTEYFKAGYLFFLDEPELIKREFEDFTAHQSVLQKKKADTEEGADIVNSIVTWEQFAGKLHNYKTIENNSFAGGKEKECIDFQSTPQEPLKGNIKMLKQQLNIHMQKKEMSDQTGNAIYFLCGSADQVERISDIFEEEQVTLSNINIKELGINQGFVFKDVNLAIFTDNQFYGRLLRGKIRKRSLKGLTLKQLSSLVHGDYVVHVDHGIGQYVGLKKISVQKNERECLSVTYRDGDILYVPLERMNRIQKYSAKEGVVPVLSKLGSKDWDRLKGKTKKHIKETANELIALYAKRKAQQGFKFSKDTLWQKELEASFEYEDTPDQTRATEEVKVDMENSSPMDRLVCGDVGYGKTEVALRAAFKAVENGKQVAVLVPTTILALQHYTSFKERLKNYPVKIEMMSRFRTNSEQKIIVEWMKQGKVDIVIGTHRLLSNDILFKNLGLLIIDEEHRFGVRNKEKMKQQQVNVDVLSMSATPIPRTLNMAMLGIRDMSLITTPPRNRRPIHTEIIQFDKAVIRSAILKEVERGGQVFFVHNRVQSIDAVADMVRRLVPEVSVAVAHGQMDELQLEKVMWNFAAEKYQCLVSTMIIESGLDIPNVNTMIINRADRFGLSQLYQLRGRVGRSNQLAFAYLLVPPLHYLKKDALKRLRTIEEFTELGAGLNIAMRDLEIRGAGNILGSEQSGHIVALGYELYSKIISEAVEELKLEREGKPAPSVAEVEETRIDFNYDAYIPDSFIEQSEIKVNIYRRLAGEIKLEGVQEIRAELIDRFGKLPDPVVFLLYFIDLKILGNLIGFKSIKISKKAMTGFFLDSVTAPDRRELMENKICSIMVKSEGDFHFFQNGKNELGIHVDVPEDGTNPVAYSINFLKRLL